MIKAAALADRIRSWLSPGNRMEFSAKYNCIPRSSAETRRAFIQSGRWSSPYYWAPFVYYGFEDNVPFGR